jgi:hypothetical protein
MKKFIFILISVVLTSGIALAGNENGQPAGESNSSTISGIIKDAQTGEALAGVAIKVEGTNITVYSDLEGKFSIPSVTPGTYDLVTTYVSYESNVYRDLKVQVGNSSSVLIQLNGVTE